MPAEPAGETLAPDLGIAQIIELARQALRLGFGRADHRAQTGQDQHLIRIPPFGRRKRLKSCVELLRRRLCRMSGKHGIGMPCGKTAAGVGGSSLHEHWPPLWAARHVERPSYLVKIAAVFD